MIPSAMTPYIFLSDNETKTDLLYYESIASTVVELVKADPSKPISIGIHGDWGAGKSSVLAMIEESLKENEEFLCLRFNGWLFQGFEDAKTVLLESIVEGMMDARPAVESVKAEAKSLFKRIDWFKVAKKTGGLLLTLGTGLPIGQAAEAIADRIHEAIKTPGEVLTPDNVRTMIEGAAGALKDEDVGNLARQIHKFREDFENFISTIGIKRLVILIDDLDRCLPETAIETLEAAKLFLFLPHVAFVVAADEGMIEYAVRRHFPDMPIGPAGTNYSRAYLEKLIQVPFRIPALGDVEIHAYIALLIAEVALGSESPQFNNLLGLAREKLRRPWEGGRLEFAKLRSAFPGLIEEAGQGITLGDQLATVLARGTQGNPRQVKRFLNSLMLREAIAKARGMQGMIKRPVLAKIMLAERFHPDLYNELCKAANRAKDGKIQPLARLESGDKDGGTKEVKKGSDDEWAKWDSDGSVREWASLAPKLADEDLRPYVFVTRDKKAIFGMQAAGPLDALVEQLMGPRVHVASQKQAIKSLQPSEADQVFEKLRSRIVQEDSYENTTNDGPAGFPGMVAVVTEHLHLAGQFVRFLAEAPVAKLGAWAVAHSIKLPQNAQAGWAELQKKWSSQDQNKALAAAVNALTGVQKRK